MPLTNSQYDELMRKYDEKRQTRAELIRDRRRNIYAAIPSLKSVEDEIADASVECVNARLFGDENGCANTLLTLRKKRDKLILDAGFSLDYLNPPFDCPDCEDTGFIDGVRCHCFEKAAINLTYAQSRLADAYESETFENFNLDYYSSEDTDSRLKTDAKTNAKNALDAAKSFVENFDTDRTNLLIYGNTGTGKTFLSHCIAKSLIDSGYSVIYLTAYQMFSIFEAKTFGKNRDNDTYDTYDRIFSCDLLVIDDLGSEFFNSFTVSRLFECINERLLLNNSTVISTNLELSELKEIYSERLFSRLTDKYRIIRLFGSDIRMQKKLGGIANATQ